MYEYVCKKSHLSCMNNACSKCQMSCGYQVAKIQPYNPPIITPEISNFIWYDMCCMRDDYHAHISHLSGIMKRHFFPSVSDCRYGVIESSSLVPVLFREAFSHPYISFFHLLVNGFSVMSLKKHQASTFTVGQKKVQKDIYQVAITGMV